MENGKSFCSKESCLLPSAFRLPPSAFRLLPSAFCLPPSAFRLLTSVLPKIYYCPRRGLKIT